MHRYFLPGIFIFIFWAANISVVFAGSSDIVISEILFDPIGTDTGLEYIVLRNTGTDAVNMSGWDLYPDGVGYFTFPGFTVSGGGSVKIMLRQTGSSDEATLYHATASGNMGNSSGSVALFSGTAHNKDTLISFARYHKTGSTEHKTWESTAASANAWIAGSFIDIGSWQEGDVARLFDTSQKMSAAAWEATPSGNTAESNDGGNIAGAIDRNDPALPQDAYVSVPAPAQKMRAYAGKDTTVLVGAPAVFTGYAEDVNGEALDGARFIWNFGDGSTGEGKNLVHAYRFPGLYTVFMDSSAGMYSASDDIKVNAIESPLLVSEIKSGSNGWIAIQNNSARSIDISGTELGVANSKPFYMPPKTILAPWTEIVLGEQTLGLAIPVEGRVWLRYANGPAIADTIYSNISVGPDESLNISNQGWIAALATPGAKNKQPIAGVIPIEEKKINPNNSIVRNTSAAVSEQRAMQDDERVAEQVTATASDALPPFSIKKYLWLAIGLGAGAASGAAFLALKRFAM